MLKRIPTSQAELGMFLQSLEGSWLKHPFWRTRFLIEDPGDLAALKRSDVPYVWIDIKRGKDVGGSAAAIPNGPDAAPDPAPSPAVALESVPLSMASLQPTSLDEELERAAALVRQSKQRVKSMFDELRLGRAIQDQDCLPVVDDIAGSVWRNPSALISLARLKTRDDYTYMHSVAVCAMMIALGKQLGLSEDEQRLAGKCGLLHDVGKMLVPLEILNKPGDLTESEYAVMRSHPERGFESLQASGAFHEQVLDVALHHHEKFDGSGYPHGLKGEQIGLFARMGAVCDVYDAVTSTRPYKSPWDPADTLSRMSKWAGHFDPQVFRAFVVTIGIYPVGTLVRLNSGRLAVVLEQNPGDLTLPRVRVFFSTKSNLPIERQDLELVWSDDRIVGREDPEAWGFTHFNDLWTQTKS